MKVSIVTPSFNQGEFIERTINSVLSQSYKNIEYIIIDGGSTDSTMRICEKYKNFIDVVISEKDRGQTDAINKGFRLASGDIVGWINSDDILYKNCVDNIVKIFEKNKKCSIAYPSILNIIDEKDDVFRVVNKKIPNKNFLLREDFSVIQQGSFYKKEYIELVGYLDEQIDYCMDLDLWLKLLSCGEICSYDDEAISAFRIWGGTKTVNGGNKFVSNIIDVLLRHGAKNTDKSILKLRWWYVKNFIKGVLP